jgi:hypothetical protein
MGKRLTAMPKFLKTISEAIGHVEAIHWIVQTEFFRTYLLPTATTMLTAGSGFAQHEPIMWIMVASAILFMSIAVAAALLQITSEKNSPLNKLTYDAIFLYDLVPAELPLFGNRQQRRGSRETPQMLNSYQVNPQVNRQIEKAQVGILIGNYFSFLISAILKTDDTGIEHKKRPARNPRELRI